MIAGTGISRRSILKGGLAAGAVLAARPWPVLAAASTTGPGFAADRSSRLFPDDGRIVAHADLHNHSHLSDGSGDPVFAFESMRDAGLDVAALTDHTTLAWGLAGELFEAVCAAFDGDPEHGEAGDCRSLASMDEERWGYARALADAANEPGRFVAIRGFEWSSPFLGHVNVWDSERWIDPLHTAGIDASGLGEHFRVVPELGEALGPILDELLRSNPMRTGMLPFYRWLTSSPSTPVVGGGADGVACFNHPGREEGRFSYFAYNRAADDRISTMEILNRRDDYLFRSYGNGQPSPLIECLNAGWRVGLIGVTDEHGTDWGFPEGKGRAGLWLRGLTRGDVRDALSSRRTFATFFDGLRFDAAARTAEPGQSANWGGPDPSWVPMGDSLEHGQGTVHIAVDIDRGPGWWRKPIEVQVLRPGTHVPEVAHVEATRVPGPGAPPITFAIDLDRADGDWFVLRIADPGGQNNELGPAGHPGNRAIIAYSSPFWLTHDRPSGLLDVLSAPLGAVGLR